ncbi:short chain dehydrogenase domain-containing protein [Ditylenchus destructor]|nr:short chain dehydrogenase domain-containing protein [Ditylenchus destructor]
MKDYQGKTAVITGAGSGFGLEVARIAASRGMNLVLCDVQQDALDKAAAEFSGHQVLARRVDVAKGPSDGGAGRRGAGALRRPQLRVQQRGRGLWRLDLGELAGGLGVGAGRQPDGRGPRGAAVHAHDAGGRQGGSGLAGAYRQHRVHGRDAESAQHGRLQRVQACGGVAERDALSRPGPGDGSGQGVGAVPLLRADGDHPQRAQSARGVRGGEADQEPADLAGDDGQGGELRKLTAADVARMVFEALDEERFYVFSIRRRSRACRPGWRM